MLEDTTSWLLITHDSVFCLFQSALFVLAVLIDAIVRNGSSASAGADHVPPPPGWRDEDTGRRETFNVSSDEKKTYTEEQRHGVSRCKIFTLFYSLCVLHIKHKRSFAHGANAEISLLRKCHK